MEGKIIKSSVPSWQRYTYEKVLSVKKEWTSNFGVEYIDCEVIEVGKNKVREGVLKRSKFYRNY